MFRLYSDVFKHLFNITLHYRDMGCSLQDATIHARDTWFQGQGGQFQSLDPNFQIREALRFLDRSDFTYSKENFNGLVDTMAKMLLSEEDNIDRDLIDTIVRIVGLPFARNVLAGEALKRLQKAVLIPEELAGLKKGLESEMFCAKCSHKFLSGEMATFLLDDHKNRFFLCTVCSRPSLVAADNDRNQSIPITTIKGLQTSLSKKFIALEGPPQPDILAVADEILGPPNFQAFPVYAEGPAFAVNDQNAVPVPLPQLDYGQFQFADPGPHLRVRR